jgi:transcriptional regulator with XRE-family HTH domain
MGKAKTERPKHLAKKLKEIRLQLGLTQETMADALRLQGVMAYTGYIGVYETGHRTPGLLTVFAYARLAGISSDLLLDDKADLPARLPAKRPSVSK